MHFRAYLNSLLVWEPPDLTPASITDFVFVFFAEAAFRIFPRRTIAVSATVKKWA